MGSRTGCAPHHSCRSYAMQVPQGERTSGSALALPRAWTHDTFSSVESRRPSRPGRETPFVSLGRSTFTDVHQSCPLRDW